MEQGRPRSSRKVMAKKASVVTKGNVTLTALALGRLALAASSKGLGPPFSREISLVETPCSIRWPKMEQSPVLEQSLARIHDHQKGHTGG